MSRTKLMLATRLDDGDEVDELVPDECFCAENHIAPSTARRWRQNSEGPEYLRIGRSIFYYRSRIRSWRAARTFRCRADEIAAA